MHRARDAHLTVPSQVCVECCIRVGDGFSEKLLGCVESVV